MLMLDLDKIFVGSDNNNDSDSTATTEAKEGRQHEEEGGNSSNKITAILEEIMRRKHTGSKKDKANAVNDVITIMNQFRNTVLNDKIKTVEVVDDNEEEP